MHLDHDHEHDHEHTHEHTHTHTHTHDHDGHAHTHEHTHTHSHEHHSHDHEHTHPHDHHDHDHSHCESTDCASCGGCEHSPLDELKALMKYMVGHNAAHANELANLAKQLDEAGQHMAYEQVMLAVSDFEKGNLRLSTVLQALD